MTTSYIGATIKTYHTQLVPQLVGTGQVYLSHSSHVFTNAFMEGFDASLKHFGLKPQFLKLDSILTDWHEKINYRGF